MSFTSTTTGNKIADKDYKWHYTSQKRAQDKARREALELLDALEEKSEVAEKIEDMELDLNGADISAFEGWLDNMRGLTLQDLPGTVSLDTLSDMTDDFCDAFFGPFESEVAYTIDSIESGVFGDEPEGILGNYIDVESLSRDLFLSDVYSLPAPGGEVHVFHNC